jgi:nucleotide-binding universal stress UspA family protein
MWRMQPGSGPQHTLVLYRSSRRADEALRDLCRAADERGTRVTVLALALEERPSRGCCDTRSVLWNSVCRELAREDLARAAKALDDEAAVEFDVLVAPGRRVVSALAAEAVERGADEIVLADPPRSGLGRLERRRLRRRSPVPVGPRE